MTLHPAPIPSSGPAPAAAGEPTADAVPAPGPAAPRFRLGTRGSALAVAQSSTIADALRGLGAVVELVTIRTLGDDRPPDTTWGEGAFVGALEAALLSGEVDIAVHSAKDVPTTIHPRLVIAAYPGREDPRDALVGREPGATIAGLPEGARVGTDSPRRSAFLRVVRPDLRLHPLHGNVDTRLRRLDDGETDALILAVAGLTRLGRADRIGQTVPAELVPPAPGQGSLAIECRADDAVTHDWLSRLDDAATRAAVEAERAFLRATGGGCRAPIGALAHVEGNEIVLRAGTAGIEPPETPHGRRPDVAFGEVRGPVADRLSLAADLAARLTAELAGRHATAPVAGAGVGAPRVLVTRAASQSGPLAEALAAAGLEPVLIPTIAIRPVDAGGELEAAVARASEAAWIVVTSPNGADAVLDAAARGGVDLSGVRWAAIGSATAAVLDARGVAGSFLPSAPDSATLAAELPLAPGERVLLAQADLADGTLATALAGRGGRVEAAVAYHTDLAPEPSREQLRALFAAGAPEAIVFTSGSTVRGLVELLGSAHLDLAHGSVAACIGEATAAAARAAGFGRVAVATDASPTGLVDVIRDALDPIPPDPRSARIPEDPA